MNLKNSIPDFRPENVIDEAISISGNEEIEAMMINEYISSNMDEGSKASENFMTLKWTEDN